MGVGGEVANVIVVSGFVCDKCLTMSRGESVSIAYASSFRVVHFSPTSCVSNCNGLLEVILCTNKRVNRRKFKK